MTMTFTPELTARIDTYIFRRRAIDDARDRGEIIDPDIWLELATDADNLLFEIHTRKN